MQKNLKSKVLLTLLAASVFYLPAYANAAYLTVTTDTDGTPQFEFGPIDINPEMWLHYKDGEIYYEPTEEGNQLTITGTPDFISQQDDYYHTLYGAYEEVDTEGQGAAANRNTVTLNGTDFANADPEIAGAYVDLLENGDATLTENAVNISSGSFADDPNIYGAYADSNSSGTFTLQNNSVTINGAAFTFGYDEYSKNAYISGAYADADGSEFADAGDGSNFNLTGNKVEITNAEFKNNTNNDATAYIYGADAYIRAYNNNATFEQNKVLISGGEFTGATYIFAVLNDYHNLDATIHDNTVTITGAAGGEGHDLSKAAFYGFGFTEETPEYNDTYANAVINGTEINGEYISGDDFLKMWCNTTAANNNLDIDNWSGTIKSAKLFDNINFVNTE